MTKPLQTRIRLNFLAKTGSEMRKRLTTMAIPLLLSAYSVSANDRWVSRVEDDPFTKAQVSYALYQSTDLVGIALLCNTKGQGLVATVIREYPTHKLLRKTSNLLEFAIDGQRIIGQTASVERSSSGFARTKAKVPIFAAEWLAEELISAKSQIAIKDALGERPHYLSAKGSSKAGKYLLNCLRQQAP